MGAMRTVQGLDALARLMNGTRPEVAVLPVNWQRWGELYPAYTASPLLSDLFQGGNDGLTHHSASIQPNTAVQRVPNGTSQNDCVNISQRRLALFSASPPPTSTRRFLSVRWASIR